MNETVEIEVDDEDEEPPKPGFTIRFEMRRRKAPKIKAARRVVMNSEKEWERVALLSVSECEDLILKFLYNNGPMRTMELSEDLYMKAGTATKVLVGLKAQNLVVKHIFGSNSRNPLWDLVP